MDRKQLMQILPHRDGMLLLDSAERQDDCARGRYTVRGDEWFLQGHFPGNPVVPGVMLCEILAQSCCVLLAEQMAGDVTPMYTGLDHVRFRAPVRPGDTSAGSPAQSRRSLLPRAWEQWAASAVWRPLFPSL